VLLNAQVEKGELKGNESLSAQLEKDESHKYTLDLDENQFALLMLYQRGIDVIITTTDPEGGELEIFDSPNGRYGPEYFTIVSAEAGEYGIEVKPFDEFQVKGVYELEILRIEPKAETKGEQVDQLLSRWDNRNTPGAAISVIMNGEIAFKNGYGMANLEYDIPISSTTIFHIASVSKQFTAFAIVLLEEEGKLSLDDDVRKYIREVPDFGDTITLRHLVHHTSGLRDQWNLLALAGWRLDDVITKEQILKLVANQKELNFRPGEEFLYCNTGFTLLAEVAERVSGQSFTDFTRERIFEPLNMRNTFFYDDHQRIVKNRAYSYFIDSTGFKKSVLSYSNVGATSLFTTVEDLSKWALNFEDPVVGNEGMIEKMNRKGSLNNGDNINYALGQSVNIYKGLNRIGHGGADAGYRTYIGRFPEQDFSVVVLSNDANFNSQLMAMKVTDIYLADFIIEAEPEEKPEERIVGDIEIDPDILSAYVGDYEMQPGFVISINIEEESLVGQATGQQQVSLKPLSSYEFEIEGVNARISFHRDEYNQVTHMILYQGGQTREARKLSPFDPESFDLSEYEGKYYSDELMTAYEFVIEDGSLIAKHQRVSDIKLTLIKPDMLAGDVWFMGQIEIVRNDNGSVEGCMVSSGRVRNLRFDKTAE
jgi:CubicO group peptidase (beta-lactamase class C family)